MQDIVKSIKAFLYDRTVSPLFGAFVTSWCLWNYKFFIIALSEGGFSKKIEGIEKLFKPIVFFKETYQIPIYGELIYGFLLPAATTFFYLYGYPCLAEPVYKHSLQKQKKISGIKKEIEDETLLSEKESRALRRELSALGEELRKEIDKKSDENNYLKKDLEETTKDFEHKLSDLKVIIQGKNKEIASMSEAMEDLNADAAKHASINNKFEAKTRKIDDLLARARSENSEFTTLKNLEDETLESLKNKLDRAC